MCDVMTALSVAMSAVQYMGQQSAAESQAQAAYDAQVQYNEQLKDRYKEQNQQTALQETERIKQGMIERAKIATISGESGALGLSSERLIGDSFMQQGTDLASIEQNRLNAQKQNFRDGKTAQTRSNSAYNEAQNKMPFLIGTGLTIAGDIYKGKTKAEEIAKSKTGVQT